VNLRGRFLIELSKPRVEWSRTMLSVSPWDDFFVAPEEAGFVLRSVGGEPDDSGRTLLDGAWCIGAAHFGSDPSGAN